MLEVPYYPLIYWQLRLLELLNSQLYKFVERELVAAFISLAKALLLKNILPSFHGGGVFTFGYDEKILRSYFLGTF